MICSKCNSEIPNGAKFCTACGAPCEQKSFCTKCGQELSPGAKFCPGCGAENAAQSNTAAVSLNKEPTANDLVATMNAAASAPVPTPAASVPEPAAPAASVPTPAPTASVPVPSPVPTPANSFGTPAPTAPTGYNNGYAAPPAPDMSPMGGFGGMSGAAAVVAAPAKVKKSAGKIVLVIVIIVAVLLGGAAAFFFTNKATALSLVMGKPKYAAMIEKESLKKITDNLDLDIVSEQIKSVSGTMSTIVSANTISIDDLYLGNKVNAEPKIAKLMSVSPVLSEGVDVKALLKGYSEFMQSVYGASRISGSVSMNLSLGDEFTDDEIEQILDIVNGAEITYDMASTEKMLGGEFGIKFNGKTVDARVIVEDDGSAYIMFPFATDKALMYRIPTAEGSSIRADASVPELDLDSAEIERLINEVLDIYSEYIKKSSVTMEKGSLTVAGITIDGKQITADISGKNLENLFKDVFEHIANDQYFCTKIVEYIKNFDPDFTEIDYTNGITDIVRDMTVEANDKLIVTTIINNSGKVLAKSYSAIEGTEVLGSVAFAENDSISAFEITADGEPIIVVTNSKSSENSGNITVKISDSEDSLIVKLAYSDVGSADFGKTQVPVGKYTLSFDTSGIKNTYYMEDELEILKSFALTLSSSVSGNTANCTFSVSARDVISLDLNSSMTISDDVSKFTAPSNVIDLTGVINGEDLNDAMMQQLSDYAEELAGALKNAFAGTELEDLFSDIMGGSGASSYEPPVEPKPTPNEPEKPVTTLPNDPANNIYNNVDDLEDRVWNEAMEIYDWFENYVFDGDYESDPVYIAAIAYQEQLLELDDRLWDATFDGCTDEQLAAFNNEFAAIIAQKEQIKSAVINSGNSGMSAGPAA